MIIDGNPLVEVTSLAMARAATYASGTKLILVTPSDPALLPPRVSRDRELVAACAAMGRIDMAQALATAADDATKASPRGGGGTCDHMYSGS